MSKARNSETKTRQAAEAAGRRGEAWAALYLQAKGYRILQRRYKTKLGEIDLIAKRGNVVAFIEVKHRTTLDAGLDSVSDFQARRIEHAAELFIANSRGLDMCEWRFDIIVTGVRFLPHHIQDSWRP